MNLLPKGACLLQEARAAVPDILGVAIECSTRRAGLVCRINTGTRSLLPSGAADVRLPVLGGLRTYTLTRSLQARPALSLSTR